MRKIKEAIQLFDSGDTRSFNEIYAGKEDLFEDVDDMISPKMRALFESVYGQTHHGKQLREEVDAMSNPDHNFSGGEGKPSGDGVCDGHNRAGLSGSDPCATQGQGRGDSNNAPLFNESLMKEIYEKAQLKESFEDDYDEDDDFDWDAADEEDDFQPTGEIDDEPFDDLDDTEEDFEDEVYEDYDDGTYMEGSSDYRDMSGDVESDFDEDFDDLDF